MTGEGTDRAAAAGPAVSPRTRALTGVHTAGRVDVRDGAVRYTWPGVYFEGRFRGTGVGIVLDAGTPMVLHRIALVTTTPGFTAVIKAGDSSGGPFTDVVSASQQVQGLGTPFAIRSSSPHRYWLVWITRLGQGFQTARIGAVHAN